MTVFYNNPNLYFLVNICQIRILDMWTCVINQFNLKISGGKSMQKLWQNSLNYFKCVHFLIFLGIFLSL